MIQIFKKIFKVTEDGVTKVKYYAAFSRRGTADTLALADEMKEGSSAFTAGEIAGVTLDLPKRIKSALLNGMAVKVNGLGTFKPSIGVDELKDDPKELRTSSVRIKSVNFVPDADFLFDLDNKAKFEWISQDKANEEDADDDGTEGDGTEGTGTEGTGTEGTGTDGTQTDNDGVTQL